MLFLLPVNEKNGRGTGLALTGKDSVSYYNEVYCLQTYTLIPICPASIFFWNRAAVLPLDVKIAAPLPEISHSDKKKTWDGFKWQSDLILPKLVSRVPLVYINTQKPPSQVPISYRKVAQVAAKCQYAA
jgi:hypothetical protein